MARELKMTVTSYERMREKLIPKHLGANKAEVVHRAIRRELLKDTPKDVIQKAKMKYLKPIAEIETIMRHFDAKFTSRKPQRLKRRPPPSVFALEIDKEKQINHLKSLPSLQQIHKQAEKYRYYSNMEERKKKEDAKTKILDKFKEYLEAELKGGPATERQVRMKTVH